MKRADIKHTSSTSDIDANKVLAILAYFGILFLVPYLTAKNSPFAQFHARQGFNLLVLWVASAFIFSVLPILGWLIGVIGYVAVLLFFVLGVMNAASGQMKKLPLIGDWELLK